ncbi:MAG: T9SS type B sorting domain-containing protein [Chitinophagaceae bacterium]
MKKFIITFLYLFFYYFSQSQSCGLSNLNGAVYNIPCGQNCTNIQFQVAHLKSTSTYILANTPYAPFAYSTPSGSEDPNIYDDDQYSYVVNLPFSFCFYDSSYNKMVVGSNGLITFDETNGNCANAWPISLTIPNATGTQCSSASRYYPKASIMAAYSDLDPRPGPSSPTVASPPDHKIEWREEGHAPCRKFIISYYKIGTYGAGTWTATGTNCNSTSPNTFQIVIYESTGIIDIFFENKQCSSSTNTGKAIFGIQNWARDKAIAGPLRNATNWTAANEGWRFTPSGNSSRYISSELYDMSGNLLALADSTTVVPGLLNLTFNNLCPTGATTQYVVKTSYASCSIGASLETYDTFTVNKTTEFPATYSTTQASCGAANGSITVTPTGGVAPFQFSINGGAYQSSGIFTGLTTGSYLILGIDGIGCTYRQTIIVNSATSITGNAVATATSCPGLNNGTIRITPTSGTGPYQYSLNGGAYQLSNTFSGLAPGTYNLSFKDANGCIGTTSATVVAGSSLQSTITPTHPPCAGVNNGSITITPSTGTAPYQYSLNGGAFQLSNTFSGLAPGPYSIDFTDALGCTGTAATNLVGATPIVGAPLPIMPLCNAGTDGSIIMSASGGVAPYQYSIDAGITYQAVASFTNLAAGSYTIRIKDFNGCFIDVPVVLTEPSLLTMSASGLPSTCNGTDGTITITAAGGTPSYLYSIDNGASYVGSNTFAVAPGIYNNILVKDNNGCTQTTSINVMMVDNMYLNAGADTNVCIGSAVTLQPRTNTETSIFTWTPTNTLSNGTIKNPIATPTDTTTYYLDASWGLCSRKDTIIVNVLHKPVAHAGNDTMICFQTTVLLNGTATNTSGPVTYAWTPASMVVNGAVANTIGRPDSTQLFTVTVKDNYGCNFTVSDDKLVIMQPPVPAYAGNDTNAVYGVPHQLFSSGGVSYLWSPASPLNNPFAQNPLATLTNDTYFNVQVTDIAGCIGNDGVFVKVYRGPTYYLPNAFSPNGDGLNDIFRPIPVGIKSTEYFRVFNRYGQMVFETTQWLKGWDGTFMGKKQPIDAYVWMIKGLSRDGKTVEMKGQVMIVQ